MYILKLLYILVHICSHPLTTDPCFYYEKYHIRFIVNIAVGSDSVCSCFDTLDFNMDGMYTVQK